MAWALVAQDQLEKIRGHPDVEREMKFVQMILHRASGEERAAAEKRAEQLRQEIRNRRLPVPDFLSGQIRQ